MNSITQNFKNVLKNKIKKLISEKISANINDLINNMFSLTSENKYLTLISSLESSVKEVIKNCIITTFEELDNSFKNSDERKSRYYINKSNVPRTLITILGDITFNRTYYINKISKKRFFYIDKMFELPKYDHYDTIVKAVAISESTNTSRCSVLQEPHLHI